MGMPAKSNPFGFGYKLPDRVQLEYVALKLQDVKGIVKAPTAEEAESFYRDKPGAGPSPKASRRTRTIRIPRRSIRSARTLRWPDDILDQLMLNKIMRKAEGGPARGQFAKPIRNYRPRARAMRS